MSEGTRMLAPYLIGGGLVLMWLSLWLYEHDHNETLHQARTAILKSQTDRYTLKCKKVSPRAVIPSYSKPGDAGLDLTAIDSGVCPAGSDFMEYDTGLAVEIPPGYVGLVFPRSSISTYRLSLTNSVGVIDSQFRGAIKLRFRLHSDVPTLRYKAGDRIGQLVIVPFMQMTVVEALELGATERGTGGFGSTGA